MVRGEGNGGDWSPYLVSLCGLSMACVSFSTAALDCRRLLFLCVVIIAIGGVGVGVVVVVVVDTSSSSPSTTAASS